MSKQSRIDLAKYRFNDAEEKLVSAQYFMEMRITCKKCHSCEYRNLLRRWKIPELRFAPSGMTALY